MATQGKDTVLVVLQLGGGNDFMHTVVPYGNPLYYDFRRTVNVPQDRVLPIDDNFGFHPHLGAIKPMWDAGDMAIVAGVGYPNPNRSHFRSMDIWHTCEPDKVATEGWLGRAVRDLDPNKENVLTAVNFGNGLPRAMVMPGVPVTSVSQLESYGLLSNMEVESQRSAALDVFQKIYGQAIGSGPVNDYIRQTGLDAMKGADIIRVAPERYSSTIEYADNSIAAGAERAWRRCIWQTWGRGCSTRSTVGSMCMRTRWRRRTSCGWMCRARSRTSSRTCVSTTHRRMW